MRFFLLVALLLSGCATTAPQATELLRDHGGVVPAAQVEGVPFIEQKTAECGPASLAMAMTWAGHEKSADDLAPMMMTSSREGSLQEDMISAARREGLMAVRIEGYRALLGEIEAGHPVIIFENLGLSWYPQWHYAVVTGYDLARGEVIMHSGPTPDEHIDMKIFERSWKYSDYWGLVILAPDTTARTAGELENMRAAAGLELAKYPDLAAVAYRTILERWPESLSARMGLANVAYAKGDFKSSVRLLEEAVKLHPDSTQAQHNLDVARHALTR